MSAPTVRSTSRQVLAVFKQLHRTRQIIFNGDAYALTEARNKINEEFKKNLQLTDEEEIEKCLKTAVDAEKILRTTVVQAEMVDTDKQIFKVKVTPDTVRNENAKLKVGTVPNNIRDDD